jgi:YbbR domain-containing protein
VTPIGEIPNGLAIETVSPTISPPSPSYGRDTVLGSIDTVLVPIDASQLINTTNNVVADIPLPSGVTKTSVNVVNMQITLAPAVTKTLG